MPSLSDVSLVIVDCEHKTAPTQGHGIPSIRTTNIRNGRLDLESANRVSEETYQEWTARMEPREGDLILAREAPVGEVGIVPASTRVCLGQRTVLVRPDREKAVPRYLLYLLLTPQIQHELSARSEGSTTPHLNVADIREFKLPELPGLRDQERIAHILGTLDDKIELNRRMNCTLEAIARAIFKSWFVDFDPVHDKAEGRQPVGMDPETATLFPSSFQESPLGKIPRGWEVRPFSEIVEINPRRTIKKGEVTPYVDMASLPSSGSQLEAVPDSREYKSGSRFRNGDVLFARITPCLENGKTVLVDFLKAGGIGAGSTEFFIFGPRLAGTYFAYCASRWTVLREHAIASMTGTSGRQRAQKEAFEHFEMAVPDPSLLKAFEVRVEPLFALQVTASLESRNLSLARDSLLPRLLSGKLTATPQEESS